VPYTPEWPQYTAHCLNTAWCAHVHCITWMTFTYLHESGILRCVLCRYGECCILTFRALWMSWKCATETSSSWKTRSWRWAPTAGILARRGWPAALACFPASTPNEPPKQKPGRCTGVCSFTEIHKLQFYMEKKLGGLHHLSSTSSKLRSRGRIEMCILCVTNIDTVVVVVCSFACFLFFLFLFSFLLRFSPVYSLLVLVLFLFLLFVVVVVRCKGYEDR